MSIPPRFLSELRDRLTLSEIIGRRVRLARAGREFKGCCPFHQEKSPSFYVNDDKQFYHCFGCGAHGDAIEFLMQHDNLAFTEAVEMLAPLAGMEVPRQSREETERARTEKTLHSLIDDTARFFAAQLEGAGGRDALLYLQERGIGADLMHAFRMGYAPADGRALIKYLEERGHNLPQMIEAGVARRSTKDNSAYSFFRDRIMFPVTDRRGRVVAFGGRVLPEHIRPFAPGAPKPPKYINSADTPLFHKGRMLYGEAHARQAAGDGESVIVVEGYLDVMALFEAGWRGAVAPLGTALTEEQILVLWKMMVAEDKSPILCFDGDEAGRRAAARACERILPLLKPDHSARFAFLPAGHDPDSLIRAGGRAAFAAILDASLPLIDFIWMLHTEGRRFDTPESRAGLEARLMEDAARIPDRTVQKSYIQLFRDKLYTHFRRNHFAGGQQRNTLGHKGKNDPMAMAAAHLRRPAEGVTDQRRRLALLAALINHPFIFDQVEDALGQMAIPETRIDQLRQAALAILSAEPTLDSAPLQAHLMQRGFAPEMEQVLCDAVYIHAAFARPSAPPERVLDGWQDTMRFMNRRALDVELKKAGRALASDFTAENEQRIIGFHNAIGDDSDAL